MSSKVIVGNSYAALIAAAALAKNKQKVVLIKHKGNWGGHFSGLDLHGLHYDAGMTIVELTSNNCGEAPDFSTYSTMVRNDVGRFFGRIKPHIEALYPLHQIQQPQSYFRDSWNKDFLLCNEFAVFDHFSTQEKEIILAELASISVRDWRHASNKIKYQGIHTVASYLQTSQYNHGKYVHSTLIEPFIKKLCGLDSEAISSLFHRRFWAPLYYPETLRDAALGKIKRFGETVIHYPCAGSMKSYADSLLKKLCSEPLVEIIDERITSICLDTKKIVAAEKIVEFESIGWAGSLPECQALLGIEPIIDTQSCRANMAFDFLAVDTRKVNKDFTIVFILDDNVPCYRITNQSNCAGANENVSRIVVEYNTDFIGRRGIVTTEEIQTTTVNALLAMKIIDDKSAILKSSVKLLPRLLPVPSLNYEECVRKNIEMVSNYSAAICLFGESSGIATRSFADQIVQGLKYAQCGEV